MSNASTSGWMGRKAREVKDGILASLARTIANRWFVQKLGYLRDVKLDTTERRLFLDVELNGEREILRVQVEYDLERRGESLWFITRNVQTSRAWITTLVNEFVPPEKREIELPAHLGPLTRLLGL